LVTVTLLTVGEEETFPNLVEHLHGAILVEEKDAVLYDVIDEQVDVSVDVLFVPQLAHCLLDQVRLRLDEVPNIFNGLIVEQLSLGHFK
jgi:hypothetical protein